MRHYSLSDKLISGLDMTLRTLSKNANTPMRKSPAESCSNTELNDDERKHAAGLMRVNHSGEVCAQALYQGQALTAKLPEIREKMEHAAAEEIDHLAWCEQRLQDLNSQPSQLNPLWYGLSFGIGASAGLISDRISLGFVAATEQQVCKHLDSHLNSLPEADQKSRAVVSQMRKDEENHADMALEAGGLDFPAPVKTMMSVVSKAMTKASYRV